MSTSNTRASTDCASAPARLQAVVVLPSPTPALVIATTLRLALLRSVAMTWRSTPYCSASNDAGLRRVTRCASARSERSTASSVAGDSKTGRSKSGGPAGSTAPDGAGGACAPDRSAVVLGEDAGVPRACSLSARSSASKNLLIAGTGRGQRAPRRRPRPRTSVPTLPEPAKRANAPDAAPHPQIGRAHV